MGHGQCDVVGVHWGERIGRPIPLMKRVVCVELKLSDVAGVLSQAKRNRFRIGESYAALPQSRVDKMRSKTIDGFAAAGVGLLSVTDSVVRCLVMPEVNLDAFIHYDKMRSKLWRRRDEWTSRIDVQKFSVS